MVISKFNSVFSKRNEKSIKAPSAVRKKLNLQLPPDYSYELAEGTKDTYVLRFKNSKNDNSMIIRIEFPVQFEGMEIHNIDELLEAMYRTQKLFKLDQELQSNPPTIIHLNNPSANIEQFIGPVASFPDLDPIDIEFGEVKISLPIERTPYPSLNEIKIVSERSHLIDFELLLNEKTNILKINVKLNYDNLSNLDDYFNNFEIIKNYFLNGVKVFGKTLSYDDNKQVTDFRKNHSFFTALYQLQEYFSVKFDFPEKIAQDDIYYTKVLYESFIKHRMVAKKGKTRISFAFDKEKFEQAEQNFNQGDAFNIVSPIEVELEMFGAKIKFLEYRIYIHLIFDKIDFMNEDEVTTIFELPENGNHYVFFSQDSIEDFNMETVGEELFNLSHKAVPIEDIDFTKLFKNI